MTLRSLPLALFALLLVSCSTPSEGPSRDPDDSKGDGSDRDKDPVKPGDDDADDDTPSGDDDGNDTGDDANDDDANDDDANDDDANDDDEPTKPAKDAGAGDKEPDARVKMDASTADAGKGRDDASAPKDDTDASTSKDDAGGDGEPTTPEPTSCSKANTWKAGDTNANLMFGGARRTYVLHVPSSYKGDKPVPLLIDMHPLGGTGSGQRRTSGYASLADSEGFIVAYPDGIDNAWNMGPCCTRSRDVDDPGFIAELVKKLKGEGCIDPKRVYAAGFSNGGGLAHYVACKHADVFAAVAPSAFDLITEVPCTPSRPISVIHFRGSADPVVPARAHESKPPTRYPLDPIHFLGPEGTFMKWGELNGCTGEPTSAGANCRTYPQCKDGVEVTLCVAPGGGHATGDAKYGWEHMKKHTLP